MEQMHQAHVQQNVQLEHIVPQEVQVVQIAQLEHIAQKALEVVLHVEQVSGVLQKVRHVVT